LKRSRYSYICLFDLIEQRELGTPLANSSEASLLLNSATSAAWDVSSVVIVGEFRGGKAETARRFDKSDKNAAPIEFGMYKFNLELLADGSPVMVSVFLDAGIKAEEFAAKVLIKRGDAVAVAVNMAV